MNGVLAALIIVVGIVLFFPVMAFLLWSILQLCKVGIWLSFKLMDVLPFVDKEDKTPPLKDFMIE